MSDSSTIRSHSHWLQDVLGVVLTGLGAGCGGKPLTPDRPLPFDGGRLRDGGADVSDAQDTTPEVSDDARDASIAVEAGRDSAVDAGTDGRIDAGEDASHDGGGMDAGFDMDSGPVCTPDPCSPGVIDRDRGPTPEEGLCLSFVERQVEAGLESPGLNSGVSVFDYNRDAHPDVFLLKSGRPNQMFHNSGGVFADVSAMVGLNFGGDSRDAAWGDFDGDGDPDLLLIGRGGSDLYENLGGMFQITPDATGIHDPNPGRTAVWIGVNLLLATENGTRFYRNLGGAVFEEAALATGLDDPGDGLAMAVADYDGDGRADIYLANSTGRNRFFRDRGDSTYESVEDTTGTVGMGNSTDAVWTIFEDGLLPSLYLANWSGGNQFFINQGDGTFIDRAGILGVRDPGQTTTAAWGDFLNEGRPALFLGRWEQQNLLYLPELGPGREILRYQDTAHPLGVDLTGTTLKAEWLDYDADGMLDLLVVLEDGVLRLYRNQTHPMRICPEGI